ncbi:MAG: 6-carboxytetrahydropterin synthase [Rickettsiales bacterium]|nr:6-carboxytetrahydropterin synthase [Rickettsiales bacterium]
MELFVDNLTVIDCSYLHPKYGVEGESWICDVVLTGKLDEQSMVMDFGHVKKQIKRAIDASVDHALLVPMKSDYLSWEVGAQPTLKWQLKGGGAVTHSSPEEALCRLDAEEISIESVTRFLEQHLMDVVQDTVEKVEVTLRTENIEGPYYHYSHGLKKHDGNCQRIAHGHRSKIEVWRDGELDKRSMEMIANAWHHIYVVSEDDITEQQSVGGVEMVLSSYQSEQGAFSLTVPSSLCAIIPCDSTVECIAEYWLHRLSEKTPDATFIVKAYEGVQKGAIARS